MSPDAPWIERAIFHGLHLHNSWLFLPAASLACFALLLLSRRDSIGVSAYRSFLVSFGVLPLVIYSAKDVSAMLARASQGYGNALKYAYLVLGLPTLVLFVAALALLATDRRPVSGGTDAARRWHVAAVALVVALSVLQSLWLYEADASL
ncbi:MAG: hypothetical protein R3D51_03480 [Hyphomicrobiaceae bacterium]